MRSSPPRRKRSSESRNEGEAAGGSAGRAYPEPVAVRGLLFDFDGLIVDTESAAFAAWSDVYRQHGQELEL